MNKNIDLKKKKKFILLKLFDLIGIKKEKISELENLEISRNIFLDEKITQKCHKMIQKLKKEYSSNILTCLHLNSLNKQKFPTINMFRQILKENNLYMKPIVISNGYCPYTKNKKVIRNFFIVKIDNNN